MDFKRLNLVVAKLSTFIHWILLFFLLKLFIVHNTQILINNLATFLLKVAKVLNSLDIWEAVDRPIAEQYPKILDYSTKKL